MLPPDAKMRSVELHERSPAVASLLVGMMASYDENLFAYLCVSQGGRLDQFPPSSSKTSMPHAKNYVRFSLSSGENNTDKNVESCVTNVE
jgi:hypothetical protein